jgi:LuxR family maltose regulon positive regulatory protein
VHSSRVRQDHPAGRLGPPHQTTFLLDHLPAQLHVLIASRADPPLPLARYRAGGRLAELRATELRFTSEESAILLREVWGLDLSAEEMASLEGRTEGWAVGLQLAALSLRQRPHPKAFLDAFTGSHRYVLDYLSEEVLEHQLDQVRAFLLQTSILERLSGPLCDAVTGRSDGQQMLEELDRANLFLTPLDDIRRWYRYHHLFADLLRSRLQQRHPDSVPELHRRAAGWCEQHGLVDQTIRHASAAGDVFWATRLVERHVEELLLRRSERATLDRWLSALPAEMVAARPRLILAQAIAAQIEGRLEDAGRLLATAQETSAEPDDPHEPSVGRAASVLANVAAVTPVIRAELARLTGEPERASVFADEALSRLSSEDKLLGTFARYHLSVADWMLGRLEPAEQGLSRVVDERAAAGERYLAVRASYDLGSVQQAEGRLGAVFNTYRRAQGIMTERGRQPPPETGLALVGIAEVLRERGDLTNALLKATQAIERCRHLVYTPPLAAGLVTLAWIHQAMGEPARALEAMDEAQRAVPSASVVALLNPARSDWARLALVQGRVEEAVRWSEEWVVTDEDEISYPLEPNYLVLARVLLALDKAAAALRLLERLDVLAESQGRQGSLIRIRALRSLALQAAGEHQPALNMLAEALSLARPEGYVRVFADEGTPMAALLGSLARQRQPATAVSAPVRKYLNRVLRGFAPSGQHADHPVPAVAGLIQPLTPRELEVLLLIAAGRRNREIADELVVSLWTVKKHVSHIFDKLVAANRTEAVAQARQLGLLP